MPALAPPPMPAPAISWSGFYVGGSAGLAWGNFEPPTSAPFLGLEDSFVIDAVKSVDVAGASQSIKPAGLPAVLRRIQFAVRHCSPWRGRRYRGLRSQREFDGFINLRSYVHDHVVGISKGVRRLGRVATTSSTTLRNRSTTASALKPISRASGSITSSTDRLRPPKAIQESRLAMSGEFN